MTIQEQEIRILKETPWRVRAKRKEYQKLTQCLQNNQIQHKWFLPEGVLFEIQGARQKINSTMKAEDFHRRNKYLWQEEKEEEIESEDKEEKKRNKGLK